jgi:ABC-2 type transport system permease protein
MKLLAILQKNMREQLRSFWVLLLTLSMGPFFIFIYYLITETSKPQYGICIVNNDKGLMFDKTGLNHGDELIAFFEEMKKDTATLPFKLTEAEARLDGVALLKDKKADALIVIGETFSDALQKSDSVNEHPIAPVEFVGDLTNTNYLISAVWSNEIINEYCLTATGSKRVVSIIETALGASGTLSDFEMMVPGLLIVSLIMLMFTASIAFVSEVENRTIMRLKLSKLKAVEFLGGISLVQLIVGVTSALLTLIIAIGLGFQYKGSLVLMIVIAALTSLSIIAFSLIIAAVTKSANEVLVVGNFPMFLFIFFTGAAFPLKSNALFTIAGYPVNIQGLMTPTHAISALNKTLVMNMSFGSIIPELTAIVVLTAIYFLIGAWLFNRRHLRMVQ